MFELQDSTFKTIAWGNRQQVSETVKYHVCDGRYRVVGPNMQLYCVRIKGVVYPDPEKAALKRQTNPQTAALQYFS
jgi:hypothetical protein